MDKVTPKNMSDLVNIGHKLLVAMVDLTTGKYETVKDENGPTNDAELQRFAGLLVDERNLRLILGNNDEEKKRIRPTKLKMHVAPTPSMEYSHRRQSDTDVLTRIETTQSGHELSNWTLGSLW